MIIENQTSFISLDIATPPEGVELLLAEIWEDGYIAAVAKGEQVEGKTVFDYETVNITPNFWAVMPKVPT